MPIELTGLHWVFVAFILAIIVTMVMRRDTTLVCVLGIAVLGIMATGSLSSAVIGIFDSFVYAITELLGTILVISIIVGMSKVLAESGISEAMIAPVSRLIKTPTMAYWVIGIVMMVISLFFWPTPAVALVGVVLLPVAVKVGLPPIGVAIAMNLFGHGLALSGDFFIQGAPKLTADAAGIPVIEVVSASVPLVIICGLVTTAVAFWFLRRDLKRGTLGPAVLDNSNNDQSNDAPQTTERLPLRIRRLLAFMVLVLFFIDVVVMIAANLQGGEATALVGGTAVFILLAVSLVTHRNEGIEKITEYLIHGFQFGFRVFGPVIPIAAFFYLGDAGFFSIFGTGLLRDLPGVGQRSRCSLGPYRSPKRRYWRWYLDRGGGHHWSRWFRLFRHILGWVGGQIVRHCHWLWNRYFDGPRPNRGHLGGRRYLDSLGFAACRGDL